MKMIGRQLEHDLIRAMMEAGRNVLLEGPVGVGKTTLALAVSRELSKKVIRVDGDGRYTEQKLVGSFDPKLVMDRGFDQESFLAGPLYEAMSDGAVLLINELNRMPEMVQNVLLPALDERKIQIPMLGELEAAPGFCVIATQNPREFVATSPLSEALLDRLEWIAVPYQSEQEEAEIVKSQLQEQKLSGMKDVAGTQMNQWVHDSVALIRLTRSHPKIKRGASIRAAISLVSVLVGNKAQSKHATGSDEAFWTSAKSVLANRIELQVGKFSNHSYSALLDEVLADLRTELKKK